MSDDEMEVPASDTSSPPVMLKWKALDTNTEVKNGGLTFQNVGDDIVWSEAASEQSFTSGVVQATISIDKAKEYGGLCSNTQVGFLCGTQQGYISGDGSISIGSFSQEDHNPAEFSQGNKITLKIDFPSKKVSWQVESKAVIEQTMPSDWSGPIQFFGKVIRGGDELTFVQNPSLASNALSSSIPQPAKTWDQEPRYASPSLIFSENGKTVRTSSSDWQTVGIELPGPGRFYFFFEIVAQKSPEKLMFGITHTQANKSFQGFPGDATAHAVSRTDTGKHFSQSIGYWEDGWKSGSVVRVKVDTFKKSIVFPTPKGQKQKTDFNNWPENANLILLLSLGSPDVSIRIL